MHPQLLSDIKGILDGGYQLTIFKPVVPKFIQAHGTWGTVFYGGEEECPKDSESCSYGRTIEEALERAVEKWWEDYNKREGF